MAVIDTGRPINDFIDNLKAEIVIYNNTIKTSGGAGNYFGIVSSERIYSILKGGDVIYQAPAADKPSIYLEFNNFESGMAAKRSAKTGQNYTSTGVYNGTVHLIWVGGDREQTMEEGREYVGSLSTWLEEHNCNGFADVFSVTTNVSASELVTNELGLVVLLINYRAYHTDIRTLNYT